ncbi:hypothetical protein BDBG_02737 [Blastomyces gilchristii SLH14081]|uniref:Uncharacterized protein n=1 Tax=Blastomyces gilchristii (strain SLH14081) TaxID=559298 RepID=A0A179UHR0_BLAGS|nr:uncharacterized protein BDBG_02737 [Blastomyces gilchristii SLH14081]OAT06551.1 hypothetical protein BDBG_02737 [Blastomyces gilchristii SLH14081]
MCTAWVSFSLCQPQENPNELHLCTGNYLSENNVLQPRFCDAFSPCAQTATHDGKKAPCMLAPPLCLVREGSPCVSFPSLGPAVNGKNPSPQRTQAVSVRPVLCGTRCVCTSAGFPAYGSLVHSRSHHSHHSHHHPSNSVNRREMIEGPFQCKGGRPRRSYLRGDMELRLLLPLSIISTPVTIVILVWSGPRGSCNDLHLQPFQRNLVNSQEKTGNFCNSGSQSDSQISRSLRDSAAPDHCMQRRLVHGTGKRKKKKDQECRDRGADLVRAALSLTVSPEADSNFSCTRIGRLIHFKVCLAVGPITVSGELPRSVARHHCPADVALMKNTYSAKSHQRTIDQRTPLLSIFAFFSQGVNDSSSRSRR